MLSQMARLHLFLQLINIPQYCCFLEVPALGEKSKVNDVYNSLTGKNYINFLKVQYRK